MNKNRIKILNITGWGRSGSTILGSILGEIEGFFYAGEVRNIWNRVLLENRLCGCGVPFRECDFWKSVFEKAFGDFDTVEPHYMRRLLKRHTRTRHVPLMLLPKAKKYFINNLKEYLDNLKKIFNSIQEVSGSDVIIDSSKSPVYSYLLSLLDDVDLYVIHLIRDPRGVAYSRQKKMIQPDKEKLIYMDRYSPFKSSLLWDVRNITSEIMWSSKYEHYLKLKYEDFIENPKNTILQIMKMLNLSSSKLPFSSDNEVELGINHSVWGNPSRFKTGKVKLKIDNEWKEKLNTKDRLISSVVTFPLLLKYGYSKLFEEK